MLFIILALLLGSDRAAGEAGCSQIEHDQAVTFFPTVGRLSEDGMTWLLPIHGRIYEPADSSRTRQLALEVFRMSLGLPERGQPTAVFKQRAGAFLNDDEENAQVAIRLGGRTHRMGPSADNGHFRETIHVAIGEVQGLLNKQDHGQRRLRFEAITRAEDNRVFSGEVELLQKEGFSVISDIDDTIKITKTTDRDELLANTFLLEFQSVPGMARVYKQWASDGASFHYVSGSPWQLYESLSTFFRSEGFPSGTFHLNDSRSGGSGLLDLFASSAETKRDMIVPLLEQFPGRKFLLVGDSAQEDAEMYGALARERSEQIAGIFIRDATGGDADADRYDKAFEGVPRELWRVFREADELLEVRLTGN